MLIRNSKHSNKRVFTKSRVHNSSIFQYSAKTGVNYRNRSFKFLIINAAFSDFLGSKFTINVVDALLLIYQ